MQRSRGWGCLLPFCYLGIICFYLGRLVCPLHRAMAESQSLNKQTNTQKHRQTSGTLTESFGVVGIRVLEGDTRFRGEPTLVPT